jgi:opacity protein-like surface antigen
MKSITFLSILAVGAATAGEPVMYDKSPMIPPPAAPSLYNWFVGGSVGYLLEAEEEMYHGHIGMDLGSQLGGWDQAIFLEVGYADLGECSNFGYPDPQGSSTGGKGPGGDFEDYLYYYGQGRVCFDLEIIPVTLNYKLERPLTQSLSAYLGIGAGVAFMDAEAKIGGSDDSDDDTVFYAQFFTGLVYNINPTFELFAGARVIYFDDPDFSLFGSSVDLDDLDDAGVDIDNTDYLIEAGARINF